MREQANRIEILALEVIEKIRADEQSMNRDEIWTYDKKYVSVTAVGTSSR